MGADCHIYGEARTTASLRKHKVASLTGEQLTSEELAEDLPIWEICNDKDSDGDYNRDFIYSNRNYALFTLLAGVRGDVEDCLFTDFEGFPSDASEEVREEYEFQSGDAHSEMHITLEQIYAKRLELEEVSDEFINGINRFASLYPSHNMDQLRIVFWFDN